MVLLDVITDGVICLRTNFVFAFDDAIRLSLCNFYINYSNNLLT